MDATVRALRSYDAGDGRGPQLYAGGGFTSAGGASADYIWDGSQWSNLGNGVGAAVRSLAGQLLDAPAIALSRRAVTGLAIFLEQAGSTFEVGPDQGHAELQVCRQLGRRLGIAGRGERETDEE